MSLQFQLAVPLEGELGFGVVIHFKVMACFVYLQQIPPSLRLAVEKVEVIEVSASAKLLGAAALLPHGHLWLWGRGCRSRRRHTFHRPRRSIPMCVYYALRAPFRSGTADSSDWPGKSGPDVVKLQVKHWLEIVAQNPITILALQKNGVGHLPAISPNFCFSSFLTSHWSLRWVRQHLAMKHLQTQS